MAWERFAPAMRSSPPSSRVTAGRERLADTRASRLHSALLVITAAALAGGGVLHLLDMGASGRALWAGATAVVLVPALIASMRALWHGRIGVDVVAVLAMGGALALEEYLAGAVIALMSTGGSALERFAAGRARRELTALLQRAPRAAHRKEAGGFADIAVDDVQSGDVLLVKPGEVIAADGALASAAAVLDTSALTGEVRPLEVARGDRVHSGSTNAGGPFELRVTSPPAESTYAGIIRLVEAAEASRAPFERLADRYAGLFLLLTILLAGAAWMLSTDPVRALAVLVVATPCPLILAAPAAIVSGVSYAARRGIIIKGGAALEALARATVLLLDKTGTVTTGRARVVAVETFGEIDSDELVLLAGSLEQASAHPYAPAILAEARRRNLPLPFPTGTHETMGRGISGRVAGTPVAVGQLAFVAPQAPGTPALHSIAVRTAVEGSAAVHVAVNGRLEGALLLEDPIRAEAPRALRELRRSGLARIHMVTGDRAEVADLVGDALGFDRVFAERTPEEKVEVVRRVRKEGVTAMVGDGINDAPALALADVGVAMGARGATAASEAADVVLTVDRLAGLALAVRIAHRTRRIAYQSVIVGMCLSLIAMAFAAAGYIAPAIGALLQEGIDVLVILNALRALRGGEARRRPGPEQARLAARLAAAHDALRPRVTELASLAARLDRLTPAEALARLQAARHMLEAELLPHEREEQRFAYPMLERMLHDEDPTGPLVQTHQEIHRLGRLFARLVDQLPRDGPQREDLQDLQRTLYGLHALLSLHFAQEEDVYSVLEP